MEDTHEDDVTPKESPTKVALDKARSKILHAAICCAADHRNGRKPDLDTLADAIDTFFDIFGEY